MAKLSWDDTGKRFYETGVDRGVLYPIKNSTYQTGVAWNGLTSVSESPSGAEATSLYADNIKYLTLMSAEEFAATIEAYTYPDEFAACDGSATIATGVTVGQQTRQHFGFCYRTLLGNDSDGTDRGYTIHIIYDCMASPSEKSYSTVNDSPEAISFSWSISTNTIKMADGTVLATLSIDSTKVGAKALAAIEKALYGDDSTGTPTMQTPDMIKALIDANPEG